jgi:hypothetical protein
MSRGWQIKAVYFNLTKTKHFGIRTTNGIGTFKGRFTVRAGKYSKFFIGVEATYRTGEKNSE